jgi:hypothetical protein
MKIISKANNENNSRVTVKFKENNILSDAATIAQKYGCSFSHNVTTRPFTDGDNDIVFKESFGTISFNKGDHAAALIEFISKNK